MNGIEQTEITAEEIADYRLAGEVFGRLELALKFGYLTMHKHNYGFVFRFRFKAKGNSYSAEWIVHPLEIRMNKYSVQDLVDQNVNRWKADFRRVSEETTS